jgi:hypothetical protein
MDKDPEPPVFDGVPDGGDSPAVGAPRDSSPSGWIQQAQVGDALLRPQVAGGPQDGLDVGDFAA